MGEEHFKVAQGVKIVSFQRRATCIYESKTLLQPTLKNPGESLAGRISPQGESIPPCSPHMRWLRVRMKFMSAFE